jgi:predicted metal-dependent phosphoesterase TrpH
VRVDLHSHTMWSGDCTTTPEELASAFADAALAVRDRMPCRVVVGQEVRTSAGELIGLFLDERIPNGLSAGEVARRIRGQGGLVYVPHPFDPLRSNLRAEVLDELTADGLVDAVEARNAKTSLEHLNDLGAAYAARHGLAAGAGSDAHVPDAFGAAYVEMDDFATPAEFLTAVGQGTVVGHHFDTARPWQARIVPSTRAL